jgi:two-component system sensor histidine kinase HydH
MASLFTPFFTTKADGTGLGLALSHALVKNHGGVLRAENRPGQGAQFTIALPGGRP